MRLIPFILISPLAVMIGLGVIDKVDNIQQEKMQQLCQIDPDYCEPS